MDQEIDMKKKNSRDARREKLLQKIQEDKAKRAAQEQWTAPDVMSFAGAILTKVLELAENGRPVEKRVCKELLAQATLKVKQERHERSMKELLKGF